jgi:hypothetical protein
VTIIEVGGDVARNNLLMRNLSPAPIENLDNAICFDIDLLFGSCYSLAAILAGMRSLFQ